MVVCENPTRLLQLDRLEQFLVSDREISVHDATSIVGRDETKEEIAFLHGKQTRFEGCLIGVDWYRALVRHPDLVAKATQQGVDLIEELLDAIDR